MILDFMFPKIDVIVSPEIWIFRTRSQKIEIPTYIFLKDGCILSIGETASGGERMDLFAEGTQNHNSVYLDCLASFLKHGIRKVMGKGLMIRPGIRFINVESLHACMGGQKAKILHEISQRSGVNRVEIFRT